MKIRYVTGELAEAGDIVNDNGQMAVVERVDISGDGVVVSGARSNNENGLASTQSSPGLHLKWNIGLPVFRPMSSKNWSGIAFLRRGAAQAGVAQSDKKEEPSKMQTTQSECQALINAIIPFAEKMLREYGEFHPYGGALMSNGQITIVGAEDFGQGFQQDEMAAVLKQGLKKGATSDQYNATALVQDARVSVPNSTEKQNVIVVALDHRSNVSVNIIFPYQLDKGVVTIGKAVTQQAANDVFPRLQDRSI